MFRNFGLVEQAQSNVKAELVAQDLAFVSVSIPKKNMEISLLTPHQRYNAFL